VSDQAEMQLCILWEGELRQAAKLLQIAFDAVEDDPEREVKFSQGVLAAHIALKHLTDDKVVCMIAADTIRKAAK
jgi:hypothetical protein